MNLGHNTSRSQLLSALAKQRLAALDISKANQRLTAAYRDDPFKFFREKIRTKDAEGVWVPWEPWAKQAQLIQSAVENTITGCVSGQKTGKSAGLAALAVWWCWSKLNGIVRLIGASEDVIVDSVWCEIRRLLLEAKMPLGPEPKIDPSTGWKLSERQRIHAVTAKEVNKLAGKSGPEQLFIVDEACGLPDELWAVILGNLSGGGHLAWATNPTVISGRPYQWTLNPERCNLIQIDSRENPNFFGGNVPGLANPVGVKLIADEFGEDSPEFDVRVRGCFPRQGSNSICFMRDVDAAREREVEAVGELVLGVDVARFGDDDSVITPRRGLKVFDQVVLHGQDFATLAGKIIETAIAYREGNEEVSVNVEGDGGYGQGVVDILCGSRPDDDSKQAPCQSHPWITVYEIMVGAAAIDPDRYVNRRSELWFAGREWLKTGSIPTDQRLRTELLTPIYGFDARLRRKAESKDEIKKKLHHSPDRADSLLVSLVQPEPQDTCGMIFCRPSDRGSY